MIYSGPLAMIGIMVLASGVISAQTSSCRLIESSVRLNPFQASSNNLVGTFPVVLRDTPITKTFRHDESGLDVSVGVDVIKGILKDKPTRIRVAISFGSKPEQVFDVANQASEAESIFDNRWRFLSVSRTIARNDRFYTFTFSCGRTLRKHSH